jgi:hypothetical protein
LLDLPLAEVPPLDVSMATILAQPRSGSVAASPLPDWFTDRSLQSFVGSESELNATPDSGDSAMPTATDPIWNVVEPSPPLVVDPAPSRPLVLRLADYVDDPKGSKPLAPAQFTGGSQQTITADISTILQNSPIFLFPLAVNELKAQLMPNEKFVLAQCMTCSDDLKRPHMSVPLVWSFGAVIAIVTAQLAWFLIAQIPLALFCLVIWRRRSMVMLTDRRLFITNETLTSTKVQSISLSEIDTVRHGDDQYTLVLLPKTAFPPGRRRICLHSAPSKIDTLHDQLSDLIGRQATSP